MSYLFEQSVESAKIRQEESNSLFQRVGRTLEDGIAMQVSQAQTVREQHALVDKIIKDTRNGLQTVHSTVQTMQSTVQANHVEAQANHVEAQLSQKAVKELIEVGQATMLKFTDSLREDLFRVQYQQALQWQHQSSFANVNTGPPQIPYQRQLPPPQAPTNTNFIMAPSPRPRTIFDDMSLWPPHRY
jgi:hypothetical protein